MATACIAPPVGDVREIGYHRQRTRRRLKTGLDDVPCLIEEGMAGICTRPMGRCGSASIVCCPSTPISRVCIDVLDSFRSFSIFFVSSPSTTASLPRAQTWTSPKRQVLTFSSQLPLPPRHTAKLSRWSQSFCYLFHALLIHIAMIHLEETPMPLRRRPIYIQNA
jgi:hypothetical protein